MALILEEFAFGPPVSWEKVLLQTVQAYFSFSRREDRVKNHLFFLHFFFCLAFFAETGGSFITPLLHKFLSSYRLLSIELIAGKFRNGTLFGHSGRRTRIEALNPS